MIPGECIPIDGEIALNQGRKTLESTVANTGDRPVQVGSHYHFYEVNSALVFEREPTKGFRLDIPAGTAVRFEPGQTRTVNLVGYAGKRTIYGFNKRVMGGLVMSRISRRAYAEMYGPTTGDRVRLADTELFVEVE